MNGIIEPTRSHMNQASGKGTQYMIAVGLDSRLHSILEPHFVMPRADSHEFNNRSDTIQSPGSSIGWHENILDASIPDFEHSVQQSEFDPTTPVGRFGSRRPRSSSLSNIRSTPEQRRGAERAECLAMETDDISHPFDDRAVTYIERLLGAIGRLRNERDDLRRNVEFLEMEAKAATKTLGTNKMDPNEQPGSDVSVDTRDLPVSGIESESPNCLTSRQLELSSTSSADTIGHIQQADPAACQFSMELDSLREQLEERNEQLGAMADRLEVAEQSAEDATAKQHDLQAQVSRLLSKEEEHFRVMERLKNSHDEIQDTLARNEASLAEATASLEEVASERDALNLHIADLQNDLFCAQQAVSEAESRYSDLQFHRISSLSSDEVVDALRLQVEELEDRVLRRTEQIGIHQHDIKRLETNLRLQEERVGEMTLDLDMLNAQKEAMVEDCADAREARDEAVKKVETLEVEVEELEARAEILEKKLEMLQNQRDEEVISLVGITFKFIRESRVARQPLTTTKVPRSINDDTFDTVRQITLALAMSQLELKRTTRSLGIVNQERSSLLTQAGELRDQLDAVRSQKPLTDDLERRLLAQHTDTLADLEHRLQVTLDELEEARRLHANAEALHLEVRQESSRLEQELADRVESDADHMRVAEEAKVERERLMAKHVAEIDLLQNQLDDLSKQARQANESRTQLESLHQQTIDALAETERACEGHSRAAGRSREIILHLDDEVARRTDQLVSLESQLDASSKEIDRVTRRLEEELQSRALENERHTKELASAAERAENTRSELRQGLDDTLRQLEQSRAAFESLQEEKSTLQMEMTDLAAEIQRSISLCRFLESQVKD
jgi:chromosome segregation ATPase